MPDTPTIGELLKRKRISEAELGLAVMAYLADQAPGPRRIADGIAVDIAAAVRVSSYARALLAPENAPEAQRRIAVRTAILLARVEGLSQTRRRSRVIRHTRPACRLRSGASP